MDILEPVQRQPAVSPILLEQDAGVMVEGPYGWHEYCAKCARAVLNIYPDRHHRTVSLYEVLTSWRVYRCGACSVKLEEED